MLPAASSSSSVVPGALTGKEESWWLLGFASSSGVADFEDSGLGFFSSASAGDLLVVAVLLVWAGEESCWILSWEVSVLEPSEVE